MQHCWSRFDPARGRQKGLVARVLGATFRNCTVIVTVGVIVRRLMDTCYHVDCCKSVFMLCPVMRSNRLKRRIIIISPVWDGYPAVHPLWDLLYRLQHYRPTCLLWSPISALGHQGGLSWCHVLALPPDRKWLSRLWVPLFGMIFPLNFVLCRGTFPVLFINSSTLSSLAEPGLRAPLSS